MLVTSSWQTTDYSVHAQKREGNKANESDGILSAW